MELNARLIPENGFQFFDAKAVAKTVADKKKRALSKIGAFVRTRARSSIKPAAVANRKQIRLAKKLGAKPPQKVFVPSKPGEPPRTRVPGQPIKRILFGYDPTGGPDGGGDVAIGYGLAFGSQTPVPARLEFSGEIKTKGGRMVRVQKRPTLAPALEKEKTRLPILFGDTL